MEKYILIKNNVLLMPPHRMIQGAYSFFGFLYVRTNVRPSVRMCVRTYVHTYERDPVRLRLRHLYQVEFCSFIVRYPTAGHPCTVDTFLVFHLYFRFVVQLTVARKQVVHFICTSKFFYSSTQTAWANSAEQC